MTTERLPYWEKCEEMSYAQLSRFIHDAVEKLSSPSAADNEELPHTKEKLVKLCDMLSAKADALKDEAPMPKRPIYDGPTYPRISFTPSDTLGELYRQREQTEDRVEYESVHGASDIYLGHLKGELKEVEQKIAMVEQREKQEHSERLRAYREAHDPYRRRFRSWQAKVKEVEKRREAEAKREETVRRAYRKVESAIETKRASGSRRTGTLPWELAAPGERTDNRAIYRYFSEIVRRGRLDEYDQERLDKILALPYENWSKGTAGFYGYIVLWFAHTPKVLMECPVYANAIYILNSGEERLLKMDKQELIASSEVKRIFHVGDWYRRVKQELGIITSTEQSDEQQ
jgi:hypothetical protein